MDKNTVVSVVVPLCQESSVLNDVISELDETMTSEFKFYEIIIVDDMHKDGISKTLSELLSRYNRIRYLKLSRHVGRGIVQSAGIDSSIGDFVVTFDPYCDPISLIPKLVRECQKNGGIVQGIATNPHRRNMLRELAGKFFRNYCFKRLGLDLRKGAEEYKVISRQAANAFIQRKAHHIDFRTSTLLLGYNHQFFTYSRTPREGEIDHRNIKGDFYSAITIALSYSSRPMRLFTFIGLLTITTTLIGFITIVIFFNNININSLISIYFMFLLFINMTIFVFISIIGEYILSSRLNQGTQPLYYVDKEYCSSIALENTVDTSIVSKSFS